MTVYFAQQSTNINAANVWNTAANGSGSYLTWPPASGDVLMANGKTITVNVSTNLGSAGEVRNDNTGGATAGGFFDLSAGVTLTAHAYSGSVGTQCIRFASVSPGIAYVVGNITGGSGFSAYGAYNTSSGTLNITGNVAAGSGIVALGARNETNGTLNITGNVTGGSADTALGAVNAGTGTLTITGNVTGGSGNNSTGADNSSIGTLTINGIATGGGGTNCVGARNGGAGTLTVYGANGNDFGNGSFGLQSNVGVFGSQTGMTTVKTIRFGLRGQSPTAGNVFIWPDNANQAILAKSDLSTLTLSRTDGTDFGNPTASDVRHGIVYALGSLTGTCRVPTAAQVAYGVPVDNTTGTALLTAAAIRSELATELSRIDATISSRSTLTAGDIPAGLSAGDIADAVRTEIAPELATIEAINDRIELQVHDGPVLVVPAPSAGQTTAWTMCYDKHGLAEAGVTIQVRLYSSSHDTGAAYDGATLSATSGANGVASLQLPRNAALRFKCRRGTGPWIAFSGVDAETLELPLLIG